MIKKAWNIFEAVVGTVVAVLTGAMLLFTLGLLIVGLVTGRNLFENPTPTPSPAPTPLPTPTAEELVEYSDWLIPILESSLEARNETPSTPLDWDGEEDLPWDALGTLEANAARAKAKTPPDSLLEIHDLNVRGLADYADTARYILTGLEEEGWTKELSEAGFFLGDVLLEEAAEEWRSWADHYGLP
jgi:hypothetical protein